MEKDKTEGLIEAGINYLKLYGAGFSVDELCAKSGISKKTFYTYFESKSVFLEKILTEIVNGWRSATHNNLGTGKDIKNSCLTIITYHIDELLGFNSGFLRNLRTKFPKESIIIDNYYEELTGNLLSIFVKGQKNNLVKKHYNLNIFLKKEKVFFEYLLFNENIFQQKEDYLKLLSLSVEGILIKDNP